MTRVYRLGALRVRVVIHPTRAGLRRALHLSRDVNATYRPHAIIRNRVLGTVHLPRRADEGTIAHELFHAVLDWVKLRPGSNLSLYAEEVAAYNLGRLMRAVLILQRGHPCRSLA